MELLFQRLEPAQHGSFADLSLSLALERLSLEMRYSWYGVDEVEAGTGLWEDHSARDKRLSFCP